MSEELKPCKCGYLGRAIEINGRIFVQCFKCDAYVGPFDTEADVIAAWNRRAGEEE